MATLSNIPGFVGYQAKRFSSMDGRAIGKFTDTNKLYSLHQMAPSQYDRKVISLYTQTAQYSNDFLQMINSSDVYYPENEYWQWSVGVPYRFPTIIGIPSATQAMLTPGIDGQLFEIILDRKAFFIHHMITPHRMYGPQWYVTEDPTPAEGGFLYRLQLVTNNPQTDYVPSSWLQVGLSVQLIGSNVGEFDRELPGLPEMGQSMQMYETMAAGSGIMHKMTKWANQLSLKDEKGNPLDMIAYTKYQLNELGKPQVLDVRWEPYVENLMRREMLDNKVTSMIWSKPGSAQSRGTQQEVKKSIEGLYWKMRNLANHDSYNRGDFSINYLRGIFGDLFYRREDIQSRRVRIYTNEAGMEVFNTAAKKDAMGSGVVFNAGDNDKFVTGSGQNLMLNMNFNRVWTLDTGTMELIHLKELDQPQTNNEYGQNKKSTPIFMVFDISPESDGTPKNNVREVRLKNAPSMTWGYENGRTHWNGHAASQGMNSASMDPSTTCWMEDRYDIFVEDLSRMVLIEEKPLY